MLRSYRGRFSGVHILSLLRIEAGAIESQKIQTIQDVFGPTLRFRERRYAEIAAGCENRDLLPHPDDIFFNFDALEVTFVGATDPESRVREKKTEALQALAFEMSHYLGENEQTQRGRRGKLDGECRIGGYMMLHLVARLSLPPRLRPPVDIDDEPIVQRAHLGRRAWGDDLERRCREANIPFVRWRRGVKRPTISLAEFRKRKEAAIAKGR